MKISTELQATTTFSRLYVFSIFATSCLAFQRPVSRNVPTVIDALKRFVFTFIAFWLGRRRRDVVDNGEAETVPHINQVRHAFTSDLPNRLAQHQAPSTRVPHESRQRGVRTLIDGLGQYVESPALGKVTRNHQPISDAAARIRVNQM